MGETTMKKKLIITLLTALMLLSVAACGSRSKEDKTIPDLTGTWKSENNDGSYQEAIITEDSIEINWVVDDGKTKSIYWAGTFTAPTEASDTYKWTSERDKEKTDMALLASTDDSKDFSYSNGKISYQVSAMGTTTTLELTKE